MVYDLVKPKWKTWNFYFCFCKPVYLSSMRSAASMLCRGDLENIRALQTTWWNRTDDLQSISSGGLLLDSYFFRVIPRQHPKPHRFINCGHSSLLGFAHSKISQDLSSNRGARDVITQPYRWRELGICAEEKHSRSVQGARGTFGSVFVLGIG